MRESALLRQSKDYLTWLQNQGFLWFTRLNSGNIYPTGKDGKKYKVELCPVGTADFEIIMAGKDRGYALFWETKSRTGKLSGEQAAFANQILRQGAWYISGNKLDDLVMALQAINPRIPRPE